MSEVLRKAVIKYGKKHDSYLILELGMTVSEMKQLVHDLSHA